MNAIAVFSSTLALASLFFMGNAVAEPTHFAQAQQAYRAAEQLKVKDIPTEGPVSGSCVSEYIPNSLKPSRVWLRQVSDPVLDWYVELKVISAGELEYTFASLTNKTEVLAGAPQSGGGTYSLKLGVARNGSAYWILQWDPQFGATEYCWYTRTR